MRRPARSACGAHARCRRRPALCVADIASALRAAGIAVDEAHCGHGAIDGVVVLRDGRTLAVITEKDEEARV